MKCSLFLIGGIIVNDISLFLWGFVYKLSYEKKLVKKGKKIVWHVIEKPTGSVLSEFFFEEDADKLAKFQNKNKVWQDNGGVVKHLCFQSK